MKLRVAYFLGTYEDWGGASRAMLNFVRKLNREKIDPLVIITQSGRLEGEMRDRGITTVIYRHGDWTGNPWDFLKSVVRAIRFFRANKVQLIHLNAGSLGWRPPELLAAYLLRIPVLTHFHLVDEAPSPYILKFTRRVLTISRYAAEHSNFGGKPVSVVHNIAAIQRFSEGKSIRQELGLASNDIVVVFLGQIKKIKGIEMFLRLPEVIGDARVKYLVAGEVRDPDPEFRVRFESLVAQAPNTQYVGYRSDPENLYASADILIMPSQWDEPFGLVNIEAGAAGKPIISSRTGGIPEVISDGENGFLFERDDFEALVRMTRRLIDNPEERARIGQTARRVVHERFDDNLVRELESIYQAVAAGQ